MDIKDEAFTRNALLQTALNDLIKQLYDGIGRINQSIVKIENVLAEHGVSNPANQTVTIHMTYEKAHILTTNMGNIKREVFGWLESLQSWQEEQVNDE
jgi:hypothetical protein